MKEKMFSLSKIALFLILCKIGMMTEPIFAQGPPIYTDGPVFLGLEGRGLRTFVKTVSRENAQVYAMPIMVPFQPMVKVMVGAGIPVISKIPDGGNANTGLGDLSFFAKWVAFQKDKRSKTFRIALKLKETFPTGSTDSKPTLGAGLYQTQIGFVGAFIQHTYGIYGELGYNYKSDNNEDNLIYNLAFGYPLMPPTYPPKQVNLYLELNGNSTVENYLHQIFISPGIQYIPHQKFLLESGIQIPVLEDVLHASKTNFVFTLGTRVLLF